MAAPIYGSREYVKYFFTADIDVEPRPILWEIALHTADPGKGDANEVTETGYARQEVTFLAYDAPADADPIDQRYCEAHSVADVVFPAGEVGQDYLVTHYTIRDKTNDSALAVAKLVVPIPVKEGTVVTFPANYIKVRGI